VVLLEYVIIFAGEKSGLGQVASIGISDTNTKRAESLVAKLKNAEIVVPDPEFFQLVVNASPVGMGSDEIPLDASRCSPGTIVCDAIMHPPKTRLLQVAEQKGCVIVEGLEMLQGQVEPIVRFMGLEGSGSEE
jgi:shikimate dehydrogenase